MDRVIHITFLLLAFQFLIWIGEANSADYFFLTSDDALIQCETDHPSICSLQSDPGGCWDFYRAGNDRYMYPVSECGDTLCGSEYEGNVCPIDPIAYIDDQFSYYLHLILGIVSAGLLMLALVMAI